MSFHSVPYLNPNEHLILIQTYINCIVAHPANRNLLQLLNFFQSVKCDLTLRLGQFNSVTNFLMRLFHLFDGFYFPEHLFYCLTEYAFIHSLYIDERTNKNELTKGKNKMSEKRNGNVQEQWTIKCILSYIVQQHL